MSALYQHPQARILKLKASSTSASKTQSSASEGSACTRVTSVRSQINQELWLLENGQQASRAFSCLIEPIPGDQVMCCETENHTHILNILQRKNPQADAKLSVYHRQPLELEASHLALVASNKLQLVSGEDMELNAGLGKLMITTRNLIQLVQESLIQRCRNWIKRTETGDIQASEMLKTHGRHQIMTADHDIRVDAQRINMG